MIKKAITVGASIRAKNRTGGSNDRPGNRMALEARQVKLIEA